MIGYLLEFIFSMKNVFVFRIVVSCQERDVRNMYVGWIAALIIATII